MSKSLPVLLLDTSSSMASPEGVKRRIDLAADVLQTVLAATPRVRVVTFGVTVAEQIGLEPGPNLKLSEPVGGTPLDLALSFIPQRGWRPDRIIIISDGRPDDTGQALAAARALAPVTIDALFVGDDADKAAIGFMRVLALAGGRCGVSGLRSLANPQKLAAEIVLRLSGPAR
jgi:uncharacterized protein YegL